MAMISFAKVPTVTVRRALGLRARRPGAYQLCIRSKLKGKKYPTPPKGMGGRWNVEVWQAMYDAAKACGANVRKPRPGTPGGATPVKPAPAPAGGGTVAIEGL